MDVDSDDYDTDGSSSSNDATLTAAINELAALCRYEPTDDAASDSCSVETILDELVAELHNAPLTGERHWRALRVLWRALLAADLIRLDYRETLRVRTPWFSTAGRSSSSSVARNRPIDRAYWLFGKLVDQATDAQQENPAHAWSPFNAQIQRMILTENDREAQRAGRSLRNDLLTAGADKWMLDMLATTTATADGAQPAAKKQRNNTGTGFTPYKPSEKQQQQRTAMTAANAAVDVAPAATTDLGPPLRIGALGRRLFPGQHMSTCYATATLFAALIASDRYDAMLHAQPADAGARAELRQALRAAAADARTSHDPTGPVQCQLRVRKALTAALSRAFGSLSDDGAMSVGTQQDAAEYWKFIVHALGHDDDARIATQVLWTRRISYQVDYTSEIGGSGGSAAAAAAAANLPTLRAVLSYQRPPAVWSGALLEQPAPLEGSGAQQWLVSLEQDLMRQVLSDASRKDAAAQSTFYDGDFSWASASQSLGEALRDASGSGSASVDGWPLNTDDAAAWERLRAAGGLRLRLRIEEARGTLFGTQQRASFAVALALFRRTLYGAPTKRPLAVRCATPWAEITTPVTSPQPQSGVAPGVRFRLRSVVAHIGASLRTGHYVACARIDDDDQAPEPLFAIFDDTGSGLDVFGTAGGWPRVFSEQLPARGATPYMLFYEQF